jgi:sec-independent protein translocase protein TatC
VKNPLARRSGPTKFEKAADGSMTLMEHLNELRGRMFKAALGIVVGLAIGLFFADQVMSIINEPYCTFKLEQTGDPTCQFNSVSPIDPFMLKLKIGLYLGLIIAGPVWLYQMWAFIAPGLHRHERRYSYLFTAIAVPLFAGGAILAFFVVTKSLVFFLGLSPEYQINVDLTGYFEFVTGVMLLFGFGFEFPLVLLMLNFVGIVTARRMLKWWRIVVFLCFAFAAIVTPTPDPFGMTVLAMGMVVLYFIAVAVAFLNDKRKGRGKEIYEGLSDDETSTLEGYEPEPVEAGAPVDGFSPVDEARPLERRYDDMT